MKAPAFWWQARPSFAAWALSPLGTLYGAVTVRRMAQDGEPAPLPVICIGNFTAGGAGKTPSAIAIARILAGFGEHPAFLTRGYGGSLTGPVAVAPTHTAAEVGDEPLLLARHFVTIVAADRPAGAQEADRRGATVVVMDDGLQNPSLAKDLTFAVVDAAFGLGNGLCVPAGPMRAPLDRQLAHAHAVILIGAGERGVRIARAAAARGRPVLRAHMVPDAAVAASLPGRRVLAFAGIGMPEKFFATLRGLGADVAVERAFADHQPFDVATVEALVREAEAEGLMPITTEKDAVRLMGLAGRTEVLSRIGTLPVTLQFEAPDEVAQLLQAAISHWRAQQDGT
ncbi:tetraacyldisaccharide 4'-kinase [Chelatococcus daeguensis]|uniref:tetraacyldisaccharide 4'-kinase n=1 Tax=Chelatococcus daeguensis TaxID=444444 RepID=UPI0007AB9D42|nr:tetraacyldisaccharide 4'-kinase [Chelatococcus daeguensis]KZE28036.1 hypothetical protein AVW15_07900 [Chelatococcus daeguensis]MBM3084608.1 tetraacyldisaccharide 4'-kinase [Chelatococcus daeguensis]